VTDTEATTLIARIKHTWRGGPHPDIWREVLLDLDAGTAGTTIVRLAREHDDPPTIALFIRTYRSLDTAANDPVSPPPPVGCPICQPHDRDTGHWDGCPNQPIPFDDPRAQAAFRAGHRQSQHELWDMSDGRAGTPPEEF
jgi:hypothetical protein